MSTLDNIFWKLAELLSRVENVEEIVFAPQTVYTAEGLSDIDQNLGLMIAGEFRTGKGDPGKGDGFSGVRMGYPGFAYDNITYNIVGVDGDLAQFGLRSSDGLAMFCEGAAAFGARGMRFTADSDVGGTTDADKTRLRWYVNSSNVLGVSSDADAYPIFQLAVAADTDEHRATLYMQPNETQGTVVTTDGDFEQRLRFQSYISSPEEATWDMSARYHMSYPQAGYLGFGPPTGNATHTLDAGGTLDISSNVASIVQVVSLTGSDEDINYLLPHTPSATMVLLANADAETITAKNAVSTADGFFVLAGGVDFAMDSLLDRLTLLAHDDGTNKYWVELSRSDNG